METGAGQRLRAGPVTRVTALKQSSGLAPKSGKS